MSFNESHLVNKTVNWTYCTITCSSVKFIRNNMDERIMLFNLTVQELNKCFCLLFFFLQWINQTTSLLQKLCLNNYYESETVNLDLTLITPVLVCTPICFHVLCQALFKILNFCVSELMISRGKLNGAGHHVEQLHWKLFLLLLRMKCVTVFGRQSGIEDHSIDWQFRIPKNC